MGVGEEEWTFFSIQVSNIQEVFPDCNTFKGVNPTRLHFPRSWDEAGIGTPQAPANTTAIYKLCSEGCDMPGWLVPQEEVLPVSPQVLDVEEWDLHPCVCLKNQRLLEKTQSKADIEFILCFILQALDWVN